MKSANCPFCNIDADKIFYAGNHVLGIWDSFPVSSGHALIITKRHVRDWFAANLAEQRELMDTVKIVRDQILDIHHPDGFNIGINVGQVAGQTIMHLHLHIIPRYQGDVYDPTGGVRCVIPSKGNYLKVSEEALSYPSSDHLKLVDSGPSKDLLIRGESTPLLPHLIEQFDQAVRVDIAVAFVKDSGVTRILEHLRDLLDRGGQLRLLTGDYLEITDPTALYKLLDLSGSLQLRVFECKGSSFHPKSYIFHHKDNSGVAFVGSSNLSKMALGDAVEWNYKVVSSGQSGFQTIEEGFEDLFRNKSTRNVTTDWIARYAKNRQPLESKPPKIDVEHEEPLAIPEPHSVQVEALAALKRTRKEGNKAGLVVLATGLGKTWLSAFDSKQPEFSRVLFVAHREEILSQAMNTYRQIRPDGVFGRFTGKEKCPTADILFASIQTLGKKSHLTNFDPKAFDYIVVDEFHHAAARTYKQLINHFDPRFLLGLTATPERTDGGNLLSLCGENLVFRLDLVEGINRKLLCPYSYYGVPDEVDYRNIPWRSNRFDEKALTNALATEKRAKNALEQYRKHAGKQTLAFCCAQRHADFMAEFFRNSGLKAVAVHAGSSSAPRASSLEQLNDGDLDIVCAVDMFNEGVDLPNVDTVMMLRPTESRILWLQQFGRGLRRPDSEKRLAVIDYIGNHRTFMIKSQTLLDIPTGDSNLERALNAIQAGEFELPDGCEVTYELEAVEILRALLRKPNNQEVIRQFYIDYQERYGERPTAVQAYQEGYNPRSVRQYHGSWFGFVESSNGLDEEEKAAWKQSLEFMNSLETTQMTKSYKMLLMLVMLNQDSMPGQINIDDLTSGFARLASRSARLSADVGKANIENPSKLRKLLERYPIDVLVQGKGTGGTSYFRYQAEELSTNIPIKPELRSKFQELVRELVDWRIAEYLDRPQFDESEQFECKVSHSSGRPILFLPDRTKIPGIPYGWTKIMADGEEYEANFVKVAVNVMQKPGMESNVLHNVLQDWFGPDAGLPGTRFHVVFRRGEDGWVMSPIGVRNDQDGILLWDRYSREEVARAFSMKFKAPVWNQGFVPFSERIFLFVTLDKGDMDEDYKYKDSFINPNQFRWQSQNRTAQKNKHGQMIYNHEEKGIPVYLFVRLTSRENGRTSTFYYCGEVSFESWKGEKPITVQWKLANSLPEHLWNAMGLE